MVVPLKSSLLKDFSWQCLFGPGGWNHPQHYFAKRARFHNFFWGCILFCRRIYCFSKKHVERSGCAAEFHSSQLVSRISSERFFSGNASHVPNSMRCITGYLRVTELCVRANIPGATTNVSKGSTCWRSVASFSCSRLSSLRWPFVICTLCKWFGQLIQSFLAFHSR